MSYTERASSVARNIHYKDISKGRYMTTKLFHECVSSLSPDVTVMTYEESKNIFQSFINTFPIRMAGRINWEKVDMHHHVREPDQVISAVDKIRPHAYTYFEGSM